MLFWFATQIRKSICFKRQKGTVMEENKIYFPRNVESDYQLVPGLGGKEIKKYILPAVGVMILIGIIPPYTSVLFWIIKAVLFLLIICAVVILVFCRPITTRKNIRTMDWIQMLRKYNKRQKIYYMNKKDKKIHG